MRKLFWCSCLGMVAASTGIYMISHHDHHATKMVQGAGMAAIQQAGGAAMAVVGGESWAGEHCEAVPPQIIDVSKPRCCAEVCEPAMPASVVVPACLEECEVMPMPPCQDEDCEPAKAEEGCIAEFWMHLFRDLVKDQDATKPAAEESDTVNQGEPSECQEDKDYHHRYPGCPYMGGCPGSHSPCTPAVTPEVNKDQDTDPAAEEEVAEPRQLPESTEEAPAHPEVDTMEFRPSDGPKETAPQQIVE